MSRIYQTSSAVSNDSLITISMWVRISRAAINAEEEIRVLEFGGPNDQEHLSSYVSVSNYGYDAYNFVNFSFVSELTGIATGPDGGVQNIAGGGGFYNNGFYNPWGWFDNNQEPPSSGGTDGVWYLPSWGFVGYYGGRPKNVGIPPGFAPSYPPNTTLSVRYSIDGFCNGFLFDRWNHIIIAIDGSASQTTSQTDGAVVVNSTALMYMMVNGVDQTKASLFNPEEVGSLSLPNYNVRGSVLPRFFLPASGSTNGTGVSSSVQWNLFPREAGDPSVRTVGELSFQINGTEVAIPTQTASDATSQMIDLADIQIWVGQCLDPGVASNFAKFIRVDGSKSYPQPPSVAAAAFGQQTFLFTGTMPDFYNNGGTGGSFSYDGAIDPLEGPSY